MAQLSNRMRHHSSQKSCSHRTAFSGRSLGWSSDQSSVVSRSHGWSCIWRSYRHVSHRRDVNRPRCSFPMIANVEADADSGQQRYRCHVLPKMKIGQRGWQQSRTRPPQASTCETYARRWPWKHELAKQRCPSASVCWRAPPQVDSPRGLQRADFAPVHHATVGAQPRQQGQEPRCIARWQEWTAGGQLTVAQVWPTAAPQIADACPGHERGCLRGPCGESHPEVICHS
mmetsp:Transcript_32955/g.54461  ORF Transcript_32955/g.54461 Transcript_32955/m.54461 type:complete len:229 (+) Transcript_32955:641-1327(+)